MATNDGEWVWCAYCGRVMLSSEFHPCYYPDCGNKDRNRVSVYSWKYIREIHPEYEEEPRRGKVYRPW